MQSALWELTRNSIRGLVRSVSWGALGPWPPGLLKGHQKRRKRGGKERKKEREKRQKERKKTERQEREKWIEKTINMTRGAPKKGGKGDILQLYSRAPKLMTNSAPGRQPPGYASVSPRSEIRDDFKTQLLVTYGSIWFWLVSNQWQPHGTTSQIAVGFEAVLSWNGKLQTVFNSTSFETRGSAFW